MEGCRLSVGPDFLDYCWQGCDTALRLPEDTWLSAEPTGNQGVLPEQGKMAALVAARELRTHSQVTAKSC